MPLLNDDTISQQQLPQSSYGYSATRIDNLGATEYTLASIVCDVSGSTSPFLGEMEAAIRKIVQACKYSPRADNLMQLYRDAGFTQYVEIGDADPKTFAKLAQFVSKSISAQSQSLGTGGPSQSLVF